MKREQKQVGSKIHIYGSMRTHIAVLGHIYRYTYTYTDLKRERKQVGTKKIALVTSIGAGESYDQAPFLFKVERERRNRGERDKRERDNEERERKE